MEKKKKKTKIWIAVGVIVLIGGLFGINIWKNAAAQNVVAEVTSIKDETISEQVMTPGTLKLANEQTIYFAPEKGEIAEMLVEEGEAVKKGTALLRYENKNLELEEKQNELQIQSSQLQLSNLREQHKKLDEQLEKDKKNEMLQSEHDQVWLQEQQTKLEIEQLQLQKQTIEQQLADLEVKSELDGTVVSVNEIAAASSNQLEPQPLIQIGTLEQLMVEGIISEYDTLKVQQGQEVVLSSDVLPGESWKGKVSFVAFLPDGTNSLGGESGVQYPIEVTVEDKNITLKPGFQIVMEILIEERKTQTLPLTAVKQDSNTNYVFTVVNGKAEKKEVSVGLVSNESIEITDGLSKQDQVLLDPPEQVSAGMDVTVE